MSVKPTNERSRGWCLTINNYTPEDLVPNSDSIYHIIGEECGDLTHTPHLQCYVYYENARTFSSMKKSYPRAHIEKQKGSCLQASDYCKKEGNYKEYGVLPVDKRSMVNEWDAIIKDIKDGSSFEQLSVDWPQQFIRYANGMRQAYELNKPKYKFSILEKYGKFNLLQETIMSIVECQPDDRTVYWIYDQVGGAGKTDLANHLMSNHNFKVFGNAKTADVAFAWDGENVIFDYSRSQQDHINYGVIEDIKNGRVFSPKYTSAVKFHARPHVICLANFLPDYSKMSLDRWYLITLDGTSISKGPPAL